MRLCLFAAVIDNNFSLLTVSELTEEINQPTAASACATSIVRYTEGLLFNDAMHVNMFRKPAYKSSRAKAISPHLHHHSSS